MLAHDGKLCRIKRQLVTDHHCRYNYDDGSLVRNAIALKPILHKLRARSDAHCCHMCTAIKHPVPDRVEPPFVIFDIRAYGNSGRQRVNATTTMLL